MKGPSRRDAATFFGFSQRRRPRAAGTMKMAVQFLVSVGVVVVAAGVFAATWSRVRRPVRVPVDKRVPPTV